MLEPTLALLGRGPVAGTRSTAAVRVACLKACASENTVTEEWGGLLGVASQQRLVDAASLREEARAEGQRGLDFHMPGSN